MADGARHTLRIGLLGFVPPQITVWDRYHLAGHVTARDMVETAAARVPRLRSAGADIVVLLAHTGPSTGPARRTWRTRRSPWRGCPASTRSSPATPTRSFRDPAARHGRGSITRRHLPRRARGHAGVPRLASGGDRPRPCANRCRLAGGGAPRRGARRQDRVTRPRAGTARAGCCRQRAREPRGDARPARRALRRHTPGHSQLPVADTRRPAGAARRRSQAAGAGRGAGRRPPCRPAGACRDRALTIPAAGRARAPSPTSPPGPSPCAMPSTSARFRTCSAGCG